MVRFLSDPYIGIEWMDRGRTREGVDCYGLLRLVYEGDLGIRLPSLSDLYPDAGDAAVSELIDLARPEWKPIPLGEEKPYDVVLMKQSPWHIGIVNRRGMMLHIPEGQSSVVEPYTTGRYLRRVEGIYRLTGTLINERDGAATTPG